MFIWISRCHLKLLEHLMSQFLDDFRAALEHVAQGGNTDPAVKAAVEALTAKTTALAEQLANNDAGDAANAELLADHQTAITELVAKLAESTPPTE